jgi:transcriptional regulator with XRE-family HTH domain
MNKELKSRKYRAAYVRDFIKNGISFQIQALRRKHKLSQQELGDLAGKRQNVISRLENPDYGNFTVNTLLDIASALDVALVVRFAPFSELEKLSRSLSPAVLAVPSFSEEEADEESSDVCPAMAVLSVPEWKFSQPTERKQGPLVATSPDTYLSVLTEGEPTYGETEEVKLEYANGH